MMSNTVTPETNQPDDADPMIDALLAEFVPSDPDKRLTPPDLTASILAKLEQAENEYVVPPPVEGTVTHSASSTRGLVWAVPLLVSVAAAIMLMVWASSGPKENSQGSNLVADAVLDQERSADNVPEPTLAESNEPGPSKPIQGVPLESPMVVRSETPKPNVWPLDDANPPTPAEAIELVAQQIDESAEQYWQSLGVTPTPQASNEAVANRLKSRLGFVVPAEDLDDPKQLGQWLASRRVSKQIARRWLAQLGQVSIAELNKPAKQPLVDEVARGIAGASKLDTVLVGLIDGTSAHSAQWYETIGGGNSEVISKRLAGLSMNADLRCVRCHDSMIGGDLTQDSYWSFVALMKNSLKRENNRWSVDDSKPAEPLFYELADGRARMANPRADFLSDLPVPTDLNGWTQSIEGSNELADGLVNSIWQLVHGRKLTPSPVDVDSPPIDAALQSIQDRLADDLRANQFNVARTLALVIHSPMARRSVPEELKAENALTVDLEARRQALDLVGAFAAGIDTARIPRRARIELAMRRIGTRIDGSNTLLAQPLIQNKSPGNNRPTAPKKPSLEQVLSVDFPDNQAALPVSWLRSIDDYDEQVKHLAYLSGREQVPTDVKEAASQLEDNGTRESALSRVWWILKQ